jgi:hypothetical protein
VWICSANGYRLTILDKSIEGITKILNNDGKGKFEKAMNNSYSDEIYALDLSR